MRLSWYKRNRERSKEQARKFHARNPRYLRARHLRRAYGITLEDEDRIRAEQGGVCAACKRPEKLVIDHDHESGQVRGLLCDACNRGIGVFKDDPARLRAAADYLERV